MASGVADCGSPMPPILPSGADIRCPARPPIRTARGVPNRRRGDEPEGAHRARSEPDAVRRTRARRGDRARAARRQGPFQRTGHRPEPLLAARADAGAHARADPPPRGRRTVGPALPHRRVERRRCRPGRGRALGARPRSAPRSATPRSRCSATRWAVGPPATSPTTTRCAASWRWPRGCRRASRSHPLAGRRLHAAHGRRDHITRAVGHPGVRRAGARGRRRGVVHRHGRPRPLPAARRRRLERLRRRTPYVGRLRSTAD